MNKTENTEEKQGEKNFAPTWLFQKGQSGNPNGRPKGSRNKATLIVQNILEGEAEQISRKLIELAKSGDLQAIKIIIERLLPPLKEYPANLNFELPKLNKPDDINLAYNSIIDAIINQEITISEAKEISNILENKRKAIETTEIKTKIDELKNLMIANRNNA